MKSMKEKQYETVIQLKSFRESLGDIGKNMKGEYEGIRLVWASSLNDASVYEEPSLDSEADEESSIKSTERVLLQHPTRSDLAGNLWIRCIRLFESGHVDSKWVIFKDSDDHFIDFSLNE